MYKILAWLNKVSVLVRERHKAPQLNFCGTRMYMCTFICKVAPRTEKYGLNLMAVPLKISTGAETPTSDVELYIKKPEAKHERKWPTLLAS